MLIAIVIFAFGVLLYSEGYYRKIKEIEADE